MCDRKLWFWKGHNLALRDWTGSESASIYYARQSRICPIHLFTCLLNDELLTKAVSMRRLALRLRAC